MAENGVENDREKCREESETENGRGNQRPFRNGHLSELEEKRFLHIFLRNVVFSDEKIVRTISKIRMNRRQTGDIRRFVGHEKNQLICVFRLRNEI